MGTKKCDIGLIGLGVMGRNLVLNIADHGFSVGVYNRTTEKTRDFLENEVGDRPIRPGYELQGFAGLLREPRSIVLLVKAGDPVDAVIEEILPYLGAGDLLIDGGNSHFVDTDRRSKYLADKEILYMGMGVSGGESGARHGPSMMPGGSTEAYERVRSILEASAATFNGEPCVAYLGPRSAGHYVKMVHNGIEYGLEQLIAESYDLMKRGLGLNNDELHEVFSRWNKGELTSYLIEITSKIFTQLDNESGRQLVDVILDVARQKGTGIWTLQEAMDLRVPVPTIDMAVSMRCLSELKDERVAAAQVLHGPSSNFQGNPADFTRKIKNTLYAAAIVTYAQGMAMLSKASRAHEYDLDLEAVARIWRGGCIIRAALLERIRDAYRRKSDLPNLLMDPHLNQEVLDCQGDWREVVRSAAEWGLPAPGLMVSLAYFDAYRAARLPSNLTQAQRDYFGAHTYERIDKKGTFHTQWEEE
jgi:6-phosphogluconate dehydrogenase